MSRVAWLDAVKRVLEGDLAGLRCPENDDDILDVEWISGPTSGTGEYWLHCPRCGAENFVRI